MKAPSLNRFLSTAATGLAIAPLKSKWMPHSFLLSPRQRPARGSSPSATMVVQGAQPIDL